MDYGQMATILTLLIALSLAALVWDRQRQRRLTRERRADYERRRGYPPDALPQPARPAARQLQLHWAWLLALAIALSGGGLLALDWFADAQGQVVVGYSGK